MNGCCITQLWQNSTAVFQIDLTCPTAWPSYLSFSLLKTWQIMLLISSSLCLLAFLNICHSCTCWVHISCRCYYCTVIGVLISSEINEPLCPWSQPVPPALANVFLMGSSWKWLWCLLIHIGHLFQCHVQGIYGPKTTCTEKSPPPKKKQKKSEEKKIKYSGAVAMIIVYNYILLLIK